MKYLFIILIAFFPFSVGAQTQGIGVTPSQIEVGGIEEWPYTVPMFVTNYSSEKELFEVTGVRANPGRFVLGGGEMGQVLAVFDEPQEGIVRVFAVRNSPEGFVTGTGIKIPFAVSDKVDSAADDSKLLASVAASIGEIPDRIFGASAIFAALLLLWYIASFTRKFAFASKDL